MDRIPMRLAIRRYVTRKRRARARFESSEYGWNRFLSIYADELVPGVVMIAVRESEEDPWIEAGIGTADVEPVVQRVLKEGEKAERALRFAYEQPR